MQIWSSLSLAQNFIQDKSQHPSNDLKGQIWSGLLFPFDLISYYSFFHSLQSSHWPPYCSLNMSGTFSPQSLCTCWSPYSEWPPLLPLTQCHTVYTFSLTLYSEFTLSRSPSWPLNLKVCLLPTFIPCFLTSAPSSPLTLRIFYLLVLYSVSLTRP